MIGSSHRQTLLCAVLNVQTSPNLSPPPLSWSGILIGDQIHKLKHDGEIHGNDQTGRPCKRTEAPRRESRRLQRCNGRLALGAGGSVQTKCGSLTLQPRTVPGSAICSPPSRNLCTTLTSALTSNPSFSPPSSPPA